MNWLHWTIYRSLLKYKFQLDFKPPDNRLTVMFFSQSDNKRYMATYMEEVFFHKYGVRHELEQARTPNFKSCLV
jgi:hypothetical protein